MRPSFSALLSMSALTGLSGLCACAAAPPPPPVAPPAPVVLADAVVTAPPPPVDETPAATCDKADGDDACFASESYRSWLCGRSDPAAAVAMFRKGTPWMRGYVSRDLESWDPGRRSQKVRLALDEEVLVLHPYTPSSGVVVVGSTNTQGWSSVDAIRADGTCVSLMADEITSKRPPAPKHATIAWERLTEQVRGELLSSPELKKKADQMLKACGAGAPSGAAIAGCSKAKNKLTDAVVAL